MRSERGSVTLIGLAVLVCGALFALALVDVARVIAAVERAQTAADAAALAAAPVTFRPFGAAGDARTEAETFAAANGARLLRCSCPTDRSASARSVDVTVAVSIRTVLFGSWRTIASGRAEFDPSRLERARSPSEPD